MNRLAIECIIWYAVTWLVVITRLTSRRLLRGSLRRLQIDDYLMLLAVLTDTALMVAINFMSVTDTNLIDPSVNVVLTPQDVRHRIRGSKLVIVVEQMQIATTYLVKTCLLVQYARLTSVLHQGLFAKLVAAYTAVGFVVMEILWFGVWCRPFDQYWAVPVENPQCATYVNHLITNAVANISTDILIIAIPFPILFHLKKLPMTKKLILCGVFALGFFTIVCAALNKYYSFADPWQPDWTFWYVRESSTGLIAANLPGTWTLVQRVFKLRAFYKGSSDTSDAQRASGGPKAVSRSVASRRAELGVTADGDSEAIDLVPWSDGGVEDEHVSISEGTVRAHAGAPHLPTLT